MYNVYTEDDCLSLEDCTSFIASKIEQAKNMFENVVIVGCITTESTAEQIIGELNELGAWVDCQEVGEYKYLFKIQWNNF